MKHPLTGDEQLDPARRMRGQNWILFGEDEIDDWWGTPLEFRDAYWDLLIAWRNEEGLGDPDWFWKAYWLLMMSWAPTNRVRRIKARRGRTLERPAFWVEEE